MRDQTSREFEATDAAGASHGQRELFEAIYAASPWPMLMLDHDGCVLGASDDRDALAAGSGSLRDRASTYVAALRGPRVWRVPQQTDCERELATGEVVHEQLHLRCTAWGACVTIVEQAAPRTAPDAQTARLASLGFMVASVCHEVTNPLTSLHSIVQILRSEKQPSADLLDKGLRNIAVNVKRILDISRRLVTFARVGDDPHARFAIDEAVDEALVVLHHEGLLHGIELVRESDATAQVLGSIGQTREIFLNLFVNAVQAMGERGVLAVSTRRVGANVEISVADTGPGVPEASRERIFEPFFTTKSDIRGTGLGLAISREIALEHGGAIELRVSARRGACFVVTLPKARA